VKFSNTVLTSIGFQNNTQKAVLAAHVLNVATSSSPQIKISEAVAAVVAKAEVVAKPAYPLRAASASIPASPANPAIAAGALFLNSPAFAAGAAVPAFPAKPATAAIAGSPAVAAVAAVAAVIAPEIKALPGWQHSITFTPLLTDGLVTSVHVTAELPYASSPSLYGSSKSGIMEFTPPTLTLDKWVGGKGSPNPNPSDTDAMIPTLEAFLYHYASQLPSFASIPLIRQIGGIDVPVKQISFSFKVDTGYVLSLASADPQLIQVLEPLGSGC
jgi:hypothetical protein